LLRATFTLLLSVMLCLPSPGAAASRFSQAVAGRAFAFPKDHGKHPDFQTEWWYFTGNLESNTNRWGFQLTFFRRSLVTDPPPRRSDWAVRDLYPAHLALTDITNRRFFHTELISREGPGLAQAASNDLQVRVRDWSAVRQGEEIHIRAREDAYALDLKVVPKKQRVLHGDQGYSRKGDSEQQASYYYSFTRLIARGTVTFQGVSHEVTGSAWMDHEFGSSILLEDQVGWDWFSLQLDDGSELMVFHLRKRDGSFERPFGTFVPRQGAPVYLSQEPIEIRDTGTWTSPHTKAVYPSGWSIVVPRLNLTLHISPALEDQELFSGGATSVIYWEGAVAAKGSKDGKPVTGRGYVELTGYAHSLGGRL
jgi:predicted secreted hydrolase